MGFIHRACGQREFLAGEGHADRSVAFGHEGHALDGADEILLVDDRMNRVFVSVQAVHRGEFAVDQLRGGYASGVLKAQQRRILRIEIHDDVLMLVQGTGHIAQQCAAHECGGVDVRVFRRPGEARTRQAESVGGAHDHLVALELHTNAGQYRTVLLAGNGDGRLGDGLCEGLGVHLPQFGGNHRQIRIFVIRHELHGEGGLARRDGQCGSVSGQVGFRGRKRLGDICQQLAEHQDGSAFIDACFDMVACGNGVIEGGKLEGAVDGLQANACQNGGCRTSVDHASGPGYCVCQRLGIDFNFHG